MKIICRSSKSGTIVGVGASGGVAVASAGQGGTGDAPHRPKVDDAGNPARDTDGIGAPVFGAAQQGHRAIGGGKRALHEDAQHLGCCGAQQVGHGKAAHDAPKAAPYSYLSVVDGQPMRHATWADCERRVRGRSGARFRKAMDQADEQTILRGWGIEGRAPADPGDLQ